MFYIASSSPRILPVLEDTIAHFGGTAAPKGCTTAHIGEGVVLLKGAGNCTRNDFVVMKPFVRIRCEKPRNLPAINPLTKLDKSKTRKRFVSGFMAGEFLGSSAFDSNKRFHHNRVALIIISVFVLFEKFKNKG